MGKNIFVSGSVWSGLGKGSAASSLGVLLKGHCLNICILFLFFIMACSFDYGSSYKNDEDPNFIMENAEYVRIVNGNPEIQIKAEKVRRYEVKHTMEMDALSFEQFNAAPEGQEAIPGINARGKAGLVRMETDTNNVFMGGGINIDVVSEEITIETENLSWQDKDRLLSTPGTVNIVQSNGTTLKGTGFTANVRERSWEFKSAITGSVVD